MHHLRNYKGFADAQINLLRPFSLLIGPNGSGKSNVIEAIELLSFIARGQPLYEIGDIGKGSSLEVRGGLQACGREGKDDSSLVSLQVSGFEPRPFRYDVEICTRPYPQIIDERLKVGDRTLYKTVPKQPDSTSVTSRSSTTILHRGGRKAARTGVFGPIRAITISRIRGLKKYIVQKLASGRAEDHVAPASVFCL